MVTTLIIAVIVIIAILIGIFLLARKANNSTVNTPVGARKDALTQEQAASLTEARSQLTRVRMTLSRIEDREIAQAGNEACASIEKVLQTLKEKPEKIQTSRQLFNYYLPTIEKVVARYQRIEAGKVENEELPEKLKDYLGNVREAMDNLYEGLFDNDKLHVDVDIEAMTIAIKRDGLLDDDDFAEISASQSDIPDIKKVLKENADAAAEDRMKTAQKMAEAEAAGAVEAVAAAVAAAAGTVQEKETSDVTEAAEAEEPVSVKKTMEEETPAEAPGKVMNSAGEMVDASEAEFYEFLEDDAPAGTGNQEPAQLTDDKTYVSEDEGIFAETNKEPEIVLTLHPDQK